MLKTGLEAIMPEPGSFYVYVLTRILYAISFWNSQNWKPKSNYSKILIRVGIVVALWLFGLQSE